MLLFGKMNFTILQLCDIPLMRHFQYIRRCCRIRGVSLYYNYIDEYLSDIKNAVCLRVNFNSYVVLSQFSCFQKKSHKRFSMVRNKAKKAGFSGFPPWKNHQMSCIPDLCTLVFVISWPSTIPDLQSFLLWDIEGD